MLRKDGRIIKGVGGLYSVDTGDGDTGDGDTGAGDTGDGVFFCGARGIFRNIKQKPTIGDYVSISVIDEKEKKGIIEEIKERENFLLRPNVSNVDQAVIVFTLKKPSVPAELLDRFIIVAENAKLHVIICINKIDLVGGEAPEIKTLYEQAGYDVVCTSAVKGTGIPLLEGLLKNKVTVFAGPSGVGKSSIINLILPYSRLQTGELSAKISRGKHTTRHTELLKGDGNMFIVDSPGFTSLNIDETVSREDLPELFKEFKPYLGKCRFSDCRHLEEPDCAVKGQVGDEISTERYERYVEFYKNFDNKGVF